MHGVKWTKLWQSIELTTNYLFNRTFSYREASDFFNPVGIVIIIIICCVFTFSSGDARLAKFRPHFCNWTILYQGLSATFELATQCKAPGILHQQINLRHYMNLITEHINVKIIASPPHYYSKDRSYSTTCQILAMIKTCNNTIMRKTTCQ